MMDIQQISQVIQSNISCCDRIVITAGSFNRKKKKTSSVLASIEDRKVLQNLSGLMNLSCREEDQGWLDNYPRFHLNILKQGKLRYSIGVANRAIVKVTDIDDALFVQEYEQFGKWLEMQGLIPGKTFT